MKYEEARSQIKDGDVLAWTPSTLIGRFISLWTGSPFSHVGIALWVFNGERLMVLESSEKTGTTGVRSLRELGPFFWVPVDGEWTKEDREWIISVFGRPYSISEAIRAGLGLKWLSPDLICSELVGKHLLRRGVNLVDKSWTPGDIVSAAESAGGELRKVENYQHD